MSKDTTSNSVADGDTLSRDVASAELCRDYEEAITNRFKHAKNGDGAIFELVEEATRSLDKNQFIRKAVR